MKMSSTIITVTFTIILFIVCTIECYPSVVISSSAQYDERHPLQIPYKASSATTYRLSIPDLPSESAYAASEQRRRKRQISSSFNGGGIMDESVDDTLARLDIICNKLKKRSAAAHSNRRSRDTEQLLSFLCKSMVIDDSDLI